MPIPLEAVQGDGNIKIIKNDVHGLLWPLMNTGQDQNASFFYAITI